MYDDATEKIREAEIFIKKAEYELSIAPTNPITEVASISFEWILIMILIIIVIGMFLFFILARYRVVREIPGLKTGLKIKKLIIEEKELEDEVENLKEAESLLEEEYREGLISKESYEELKSKYEEKILDVKTYVQDSLSNGVITFAIGSSDEYDNFDSKEGLIIPVLSITSS